MTDIHETAYPRFKPYLSTKELQEVFLLSTDELALLNGKTKIQNHVSRLGFALLLKCYQFLARPIRIDNINAGVKKYIAKQLSVDFTIDLSSYPKATFKRHKNIIRDYLAMNTNRHARRQLMKKAALEAATTKENLADFINRMIEEVLHERYELPAYQALVRRARAARTVTHYRHYRLISNALSNEQKQFINALVEPNNEKGEAQLK
jgi:hypothetical protein